jgi:nuclear transport factor 2 (NTF2) superfamily protein
MNTKLDKILAEISAGELVDKITILEIKKNKISDENKLKEIDKELNSLNYTMDKFILEKSKILTFKDQLKEINLKLWDIEDGKRKAEKNNDFGKIFIELARNVYRFNDERAKIKLKINEILGSNIKEVKSHF